MYAVGKGETAAIMPLFSVTLDGNAIRLRAVFPEGVTGGRLHLPWYPLYDRYTADEETHFIDYYRDGIEGACNPYFQKRVSSPVTFTDSLSRQASLRISVTGGSLTLVSRTLPDMAYALYLSSDAQADGNVLDVCIEVLPPRATVSGGFYYPCGTDADVRISENGTERTETLSVPTERGIHTRKDSHNSWFSYCAIPDSGKMLSLAADAVRQTLWKTGNLEGVPPQAFDPVLLEPQTREKMCYCSHGMRAISCLCAQAIRAEDVRYAETALHAFRQVAKMSARLEDGALFTPLLMDDNGDTGPFKNSCRPGDTGILIRGLIHTALAFRRFGREKDALECIRLARDYALCLAHMQCGDGSFYERYRYPECTPASTDIFKGTVNNWCLQLWYLLPLLKSAGEDAVYEKVRRMIIRFIDSQLDREPSILEMPGGGEDAADFGDAQNTAATLFGIRYLMTGDAEWKDYMEQALRKSWLLSCMWADMPQYFCIHGNSDLGNYYDYPCGLFSAGGMHDLTAVEANLFAAEECGSKFGADMAENLHNARLGSFFLDNGGMYMVLFQCPNVYHRDERHSEMLMYGGFGVYEWHSAEKSSFRLQ